MIITEYSVAGPAHISIAIVADLHEFEPKPVLSRLASINPDVIAVPGDLFENHEYGENLDKEDDSLISRLLCRIIHLANRLAGLRWRQKHRCCKQNAYDFLMKASEIAPVVMSLGNHELYLTEEDKAVLKDANVALLNNSTAEIKNVLFGGIPSKQITGKIDTEFLASFSELPGYKVLLCHHPEYYGPTRLTSSFPATAMAVRLGFAITVSLHRGRGYYLVIITVSMTVGWWYHPAAPILHLFHGSGMNPRSWLCG